MCIYFLVCILSPPGKDKGDSLRNAAADFEGTEVSFVVLVILYCY